MPGGIATFVSDLLTQRANVRQTVQRKPNQFPQCSAPTLGTTFESVTPGGMVIVCSSPRMVIADNGAIMDRHPCCASGLRRLSRLQFMTESRREYNNAATSASDSGSRASRMSVPNNTGNIMEQTRRLRLSTVWLSHTGRPQPATAFLMSATERAPWSAVR